MNKHEQACCTKYRHWLSANASKKKLQSHPWEVKSSRGTNTITFASVPDHQRNGLLACTTDKGGHYKISDESAGAKPYDGVFYRLSPAYLIFFYTKNFYLISIQNFLHEVKTSRNKSISEDRAKEISIISSSYTL